MNHAFVRSGCGWASKRSSGRAGDGRRCVIHVDGDPGRLGAVARPVGRPHLEDVAAFATGLEVGAPGAVVGERVQNDTRVNRCPVIRRAVTHAATAPKLHRRDPGGGVAGGCQDLHAFGRQIGLGRGYFAFRDIAVHHDVVALPFLDPAHLIREDAFDFVCAQPAVVERHFVHAAAEGIAVVSGRARRDAEAADVEWPACLSTGLRAAQPGQASLLGAVDPQHQLLAVEAGHDVVPVILDQADLAGDPAHCAGAAVVELCYGNQGVRL